MEREAKRRRSAEAGGDTDRHDAGGARLRSGGNPQFPEGDGECPVQSCIAAMPGWTADLGRRLAGRVTATVPDAAKGVRLNAPLYGVEGQGWFLSFRVFTRSVKITLFRGTSPDPMPPGGTAKSGDTRWIDIRANDALDEAQLKRRVSAAAALPGRVP